MSSTQTTQPQPPSYYWFDRPTGNYLTELVKIEGRLCCVRITTNDDNQSFTLTVVNCYTSETYSTTEYSENYQLRALCLQNAFGRNMHYFDGNTTSAKLVVIEFIGTKLIFNCKSIPLEMKIVLEISQNPEQNFFKNMHPIEIAGVMSETLKAEELSTSEHYKK